MSKINWKELLGWKEEQLDEVRHIGYAYIRQGKYQIALSLFQALVVLDNTSSYDLQTLGALHLELNHPQEACKYLERALQFDADHSPTLLNLVKALFALGKKEEGVRLANILKEDPNPKVSNVAKALLMAYT